MNDSISFDVGKLGELRETFAVEKSNITNIKTAIDTYFNTIDKNWDGDIKASAQQDFSSARRAMDSIESNAETIARIISDKVESFGNVKY